jgi:hypothetical protein
MSLLRAAQERSQSLGLIGSKLLEHVNNSNVDIENFPLSLYEQQVEVERLGREFGSFLALAVSVLLCDVFIQLPLSDALILALADLCLEPLKPKPGASDWDLSKEKLLHKLPIKPMNEASTKTNVFFTEVYADVSLTFPRVAGRLQKLSRFFIGLYNDQACAVVLMACALRNHVDLYAELCLRFLHDPEGCKSLTTILKGSGNNSTFLGAMLCECQCLQGRGVNIPDIRSQCLERVGEAGHEKAPQLFSDNTLRQAIRTVIDMEVDLTKYRYKTMDSFWSSRWLWCVNGSHSRSLERHEPNLGLSFSSRAHRRVAMENWKSNPLENWSGMTYVSASIKLENGKSRLLLSCDTRNYMAFTHFLAPVEKCWRNLRTVLDPGSLGQTELVDRIRNLKGSVYVMMDYDDFNAQHTLRAQEIVIEELADKIGYPVGMTQVLRQSLYRMQVSYKGEDLGFISSTLMSGHRATTFFNSILNSAYIYCIAPEAWLNFESLHTGDDIVARVDSVQKVSDLFSVLKNSGLKANPMKQSVGPNTAEFLRMAINKNFSIGYVARAISSCISGNWVSPNPMKPQEAIVSIITSVRSVMNRCNDDSMHKLFIRSANRLTGISRRLVAPLLSGEIAYGQGPVYRTDYCWSGFDINVTFDEPKFETVELASYATIEYLSKHTTPIERRAMLESGVSVKRMMLEASYAKSLAQDNSANMIGTLSIHKRGVRRVERVCNSSDAVKIAKNEGELIKYPLLSLVKDRLPSSLVRSLLHELGVEVGTDLMKTAWGSESRGVTIMGRLPYSEASSLCKKVGGWAVYVTSPILM